MKMMRSSNESESGVLPSIWIGLVLVDCADVTVSVSILRETIVCGGRQLTSQKLSRIPLTDVDAPVASRMYAAHFDEVKNSN